MNILLLKIQIYTDCTDFAQVYYLYIIYIYMALWEMVLCTAIISHVKGASSGKD